MTLGAYAPGVMSFTDTLVVDVLPPGQGGLGKLNNLVECCEPYSATFTTDVMQVELNPTTATYRGPVQGFKFKRPIDRFVLSVDKLVVKDQPEGQCPGFELELRIGQAPWMMSKPLVIVQFQPNLLYETTDQTGGFGPYNFSGFLLEIDGRLGNRVDIYGRPIDATGEAGSARGFSMTCGIMAAMNGLDPSLQIARTPGVPGASTVVFSALPVITVTP